MHETIPYMKPFFHKLLLKTFILLLKTVKNIKTTKEKNSKKVKFLERCISQHANRYLNMSNPLVFPKKHSSVMIEKSNVSGLVKSF